MIRSFIVGDKLEFIQDHATSFYPYADNSIIVQHDNGLVTSSTTLVPPRAVFRTNPTISDVNDDPELRKRMTKYFFHKFKNDWLYQSLTELQKYLEIKDGQVQFVKSIDSYSKTNESSDQKIKFIHEEVFTKHEMLTFLDKYVRKYNVNWYDLKTKHKHDVQDQLQHKIKNHMKKLVLEKL
jgi:hypothetical protein